MALVDVPYMTLPSSREEMKTRMSVPVAEEEKEGHDEQCF